jgi:hypothetical protein
LVPAVAGGYTLDDFTIDLDAMTVTCPEQITVTISAKTRTARFGTACDRCPVRQQCTNAKSGRVIKVHPNHALLAAARVFADTDHFDTTYRQHRPMIERTIAWLVRDNHRRVRFRFAAQRSTSNGSSTSAWFSTQPAPGPSTRPDRPTSHRPRPNPTARKRHHAAQNCQRHHNRAPTPEPTTMPTTRKRRCSAVS